MAESDNSSKMMRDVDRPLHAIGFQMDTMSPQLVSGRLTVTEACCQPFGFLHGGISALIAEALGSIGAHLALSGFQRVAGVQLSINHLKPARLGDCILAEATPLNLGRTVHVWQVGLWKLEPSNGNTKGDMVASSRITVVCNLPVPENVADSAAMLRKHARL